MRQLHSGHLRAAEHPDEPGHVDVQLRHSQRERRSDQRSRAFSRHRLAGLGGDVRTYQPTLSYTQFFPMRRKKSQHPEVFGFRIIAGTVGSFATTEK